MEKTMEKIVALAKNRGFVYPGSEIYGGLANTWDYGNLGVELKNNVKKAWWKKFIQENPYNVGVDCAILMNPQTWVASGHLGGFSDPLMDCKSCKERFRADKLIEDYMDEHKIEHEGGVDGWSQEEMKAYIDEHDICCPKCGKKDFTDIRQFNLMFKTFQGVTEDAKNTVYLRPETAQGIFVNFKNVQRTSRKKSDRAGNLSVMRSHRVTLPSVLVSLSRWSWSSSANRELTWSGSSTGEHSAVTGSFLLVSKRMRCVFVTILRRNFVSIVKEPPISSICSRLDGVSCGVSQTVLTTT